MNKENKSYVVTFNRFSIPENKTRQEKIKLSVEYTEKQTDKLFKKLNEASLTDGLDSIKVAGALQTLVVKCNQDVINLIKDLDFVKSVSEDKKIILGKPRKNNKLNP